MVVMVVIVVIMVMVMGVVMVENVWEWREEMTLLPEAVGAGMWKPEYEFPGMHCTIALPNVRHSCHAVPIHPHAGSSHSTYFHVVRTHMLCSTHTQAVPTRRVSTCSAFVSGLYAVPAIAPA